MFKAAVVLLLASASALASPLVARQTPPSGVSCGSNTYSSSDITAAINAGIKDKASGNLPGKFIYKLFRQLIANHSSSADDYPHQYYSEASEHITLYCSGDGPWYEVCHILVFHILYSALITTFVTSSRSFLAERSTPPARPTTRAQEPTVLSLLQMAPTALW